jgi:hypothetical protein
MPRSRSRSTGGSPKSRARSKRKMDVKDFLDMMHKRARAFFSYMVFYIATLPESWKSRRELFFAIKCFSILFTFLSSASVLGFENQGLRFMGWLIGLYSLSWYVTIQFFAPKIVVVANTQTKKYSGIVEKAFASVYVADTGYKNVDGTTIFGLFASTFIPAG